MDDVVARVRTPETAQPEPVKQPEGQVEVKLVEKPEVSIEASKYSVVHEKPYAVDYFNIDFWDMLNDEVDVNHVRTKINAIDKYVLNEINDGKYSDSLYGYHQAIEDIKKNLKIEEYEDAAQKLGKISKYIELLNKQRKEINRIKNIRRSMNKLMRDTI